MTPDEARRHLLGWEGDPETFRAQTLVLGLLNDAENQRDDARAAIVQVRRLHRPGENAEAVPTCRHCLWPWPCPTRQATDRGAGPLVEPPADRGSAMG
jgi:hypothetical protein